ncbi:MAG: hypothetical protein K2G24_00740 [Muribaculaceae bacterium]|nr:hypothetical protein [Muribaculaceae bacterium]
MDYQELKKLAGFGSLHEDCTVERFDGIDLDAALRPKLESDYLKWLDSADPDLLRIEDVRTLAVLTSRGGATVLELPDSCRRLVAVRLAGWSRRAEIVEADSGDPRLARIGNEYASPGIEHPLAIRRGRQYELWPAAPATLPVAAALAEAKAIMK